MTDTETGFVRSPSTVALDDVQRSARGLLELYGTLASQLEDGLLRELLTRHRAQLGEALEDLTTARQDAGDLPAGGDVEPAQWKSLALRIKALLGEGPETGALADEAAAGCRELADQIRTAQGRSLRSAVSDALQRLADRVAEQERALQSLR